MANKNKIATELLSQEYVLIDASRTPPLKIFATVYGKNITLRPHHGKDHFKFCHSDPEKTKGVVGLMQEALKLIPKDISNAKRKKR